MNPLSGYGKSIAAVLAGSGSTIVVYIINQVLAKYSMPPLPAEITAAIQTLLTTGAVYYSPQGGTP